MLKFLTALVLLSSFANADEVLVKSISSSRIQNSSHQVTYNVSKELNEVSLTIDFGFRASDCDRGEYTICSNDWVSRYKLETKVEGLKLVENEIIFPSSKGDILCAYIEKGFLNRQKLKVTGECSLIVDSFVPGKPGIYDLYFITK